MAQLGVIPAQRGEFLPLSRVQPVGVLAVADLVLADPVPQRFPVNTQVSGDLSDRAPGLFD